MLIDGNCFPHNKALILRFVHTVAAQATNPASGVSALDATDVSGLIQVAGKAALIGLCGAEFGRVADVVGRS